MRRAIALSRRGFPAPNPHVGCVVVRDGQIVGEGFHAYAGGPHAEVAALEQAGSRSIGATAYVTLEPCNHHGRTGPCSLALVKAGVACVAFAVADPSPKACGGAKRLSEAGIAVESGILAEEAAAANGVWLTAQALGRPYVVLKAAMTLDGRIALPSGESRWITGEAARRQAHRLRAEMGAVLVGAGTVRADNPRLTARLSGVRNQPLRVVLDAEGCLSGEEDVFNEGGRTLHILGSPSRAKTEQHMLPLSSGCFEIQTILNLFWREGCTSLLVEGGAATLAGFLESGLYERLELFVAGKLFGAGPSWVGGQLTKAVPELPELRFGKVRKLAEDLWITAYPERSAQ